MEVARKRALLVEKQYKISKRFGESLPFPQIRYPRDSGDLISLARFP
jgi:hypothetical protein